MFGSIGGPEVILLFIVALLIFGPRKLPELGRSIGKAMADFRRATNDFKSNLEREVQIDAVKEVVKPVETANTLARGALADLAAAVAAPAPQPSSASPAAETPSTAVDGAVTDGGTDSVH